MALAGFGQFVDLTHGGPKRRHSTFSPTNYFLDKRLLIGPQYTGFAAPTPSPVRASTRPLPQPARHNSKNLGLLRVFAVKIFEPKLPPSHQHPPIFTQKIPKIFPNRSLNIGPCASTMHPCESGKKPDGHGIGLHALALAPPAPVHGGPAG